MVNEQLMDWIKENQAKGYTLDQLRANMVQSGYQEADIQEAFNSIQSTVATPNTPAALPAETAQQPKKTERIKQVASKKGVWIPALVLLVGLIGLIIFLSLPT